MAAPVRITICAIIAGLLIFTLLDHPAKRTEPKCWARVAPDGRVLEVHGDNTCAWRKPIAVQPKVTFNYAPLTAEQNAAYRRKL
jgi:hypothetical protein